MFLSIISLATSDDATIRVVILRAWHSSHANLMSVQLVDEAVTSNDNKWILLVELSLLTVRILILAHNVSLLDYHNSGGTSKVRSHENSVKEISSDLN